MLISASERTVTVKEESVGVVTQGAKTYLADISLPVPVELAIQNARAQIDVWKY